MEIIPPRMYNKCVIHFFLDVELKQQASISASETLAYQQARMGSDYENHYGCTSVAGVDLSASGKT